MGERRLPRPGLAHLSQGLRPQQEVPDDRRSPRRPLRLRRPARRSARGRSSATSYFQPNPRGSYGQGEKFVQANRKDFGYGDLRDILTGIDAIEKKVSVDDHRIGLTGWSYGGFMSMFAATQTNRFRTIVAGAGISDWKSYYGENSIDQWMIPFFGASVYDDPAVYAKSSAIEYIKNAKTPMLIIVGDRDGECPAPQSFEMWHALRAQGVKTQLVVYPNEGHGFTNPATHPRPHGTRSSLVRGEHATQPITPPHRSNQLRPALPSGGWPLCFFAFSCSLSDDSCTPYLLVDRPTPKLETRKFSQLTVLPFSFRSG